jgi:hypothetical protein
MAFVVLIPLGIRLKFQQCFRYVLILHYLNDIEDWLRNGVFGFVFESRVLGLYFHWFLMKIGFGFRDFYC